MIKINLLPAHILERQRLRSVIVLVVVVLLIEVGILGLVMTRVKQQLTDRQTELKYWQGRASAVGQLDQTIQATNGQVFFYGRWVLWKTAIEKYHDSWAEVLGEIAKWIYRGVQVDRLSPTPAQVQIVGRTASLESFRKAYLNIIRSDVLSNVSFSITGISGGFSEGQVLPRAGGGGLRAPAAAPAGGGRIRISLGGGRSSRNTGATAPAAPRVRGGPAQFGAGFLPVGVTFQCVLRPEYGLRLNPPAAPIGGAPVGGGRGAPAAGGRPGGRIRIGMGRR